MRVTNLRVLEVGPIKFLDIAFRNGTDPTKADTVLFVGPNGSGKSTLLYAIAGCFDQLPELRDRMWSQNSRVYLNAEVEGQSRSATALRHGEQDVRGPYAGGVVQGAYYLFTYSGTRSFEPEDGPVVTDSHLPHVRFTVPGSFDSFRNWVSDILGRRDAALVQQQPVAAETVSAGLRRLEDFLAKVTGRRQQFTRRISDGEILLADGTSGVPLHVLPEGLKSMLGWMGDLLRRLYAMDPGRAAHHELPIVVLLDEIEVHLHPKWQRLVVPAVEQLLPNAQIFLSTHSPFVLASASDAQIVWLPEPGSSTPEDLPTESLRGLPYTAVFELMGIDSLHDVETASGLAELDRVVARVHDDVATMSDFDSCARQLPQTEDIALTVDFQRSQLRHWMKARVKD